MLSRPGFPAFRISLHVVLREIDTPNRRFSSFSGRVAWIRCTCRLLLCGSRRLTEFGLACRRGVMKGVHIMRVRSLVIVSSLPLLAGVMYGYGHSRSTGVILDPPVPAWEQGAISSREVAASAEVSSIDFDETVGLDCSACGGGGCANGNCGGGRCCREGWLCSGGTCMPFGKSPEVLDASPAD